VFGSARFMAPTRIRRLLADEPNGLIEVPTEPVVQEPERGPADGPVGDAAGEQQGTEDADHASAKPTALRSPPC
jgi:hypothetical protein